MISQPISSDEANWIASATSYYASTADPSFTVITAQQVNRNLHYYFIKTNLL